MTNVLLIGHTGYMGSFLLQELECDHVSSRDLKHNGKSYDYVINCVGVPNLEYCEEHPDETNFSNRDVVGKIQGLWPEAKLINFSSYYVYDDLGLCNEESKVTSAYSYCRQKLEGEKLMKNGVSFRIGKLFGKSPVSQRKLTEHILDPNVPEVSLDRVPFNPTSLDQVLRVVKFELETGELNGIFNLSNAGFTSHLAYGEFIASTLNLAKSIKEVGKIPRSFTNYGRFLMSCAKLEKHIELVPWEEDLLKYLKDENYVQ
jgi:dTDP-4-dehydrorhamnose reductase